MEKSSVRFLQISDIHLFADPQGSLLGVPTQDSFAAVIKLIQKETQPIDFIILSGDLSQDYSEASYACVAAALKPLQIPVYYVPGNHDSPKVMTRVYPLETISNHRHIILKHWHIILLDSHQEGAVAGYLDQAQFNFMEHCLNAYPEHHAIILFHHQPVSVGTTWLEDIGLTNAKQFWEVVARYPKVHTVLFGHVHQEFIGKVNDIPCYSPPSTCIQFKPKQGEFALDHLPPGFRWVNLDDKGVLETGITRAEEYVGVFDEKAKGY